MNRQKLRTLVEGAIMIALATVLSFIKVYKLPWGGSITLLSMLPVVVFSLRHGVRSGLFVAFTNSIVQLVMGIVLDGLLGWGLTPVMLVSCIFCDYIGAYTVIGLAGLFRGKGIAGRLGGTALGIALRFVFHTISGVFIFASCGMLWEGFYTENTWVYSLIYNASYMLPEMVFTLIGAAALLKAPQTARLISAE